jgi:hypothetical protein
MIELTHYSCWRQEPQFKGTPGETFPRYHLSLNVERLDEDDLIKRKKEISDLHHDLIRFMPRNLQIAFPEPTFYPPKPVRSHSS